MKGKSLISPPGARGRRFKLFPDGDVFIYRKREEDGSLEPLARTNDAGEQVALQFHNVDDAVTFIKRISTRELSGQTVIVAELRRLFTVEAEEQIKVKMKEKKRMLADPKAQRKTPTEVIAEDAADKESA